MGEPVNCLEEDRREKLKALNLKKTGEKVNHQTLTLSIDGLGSCTVGGRIGQKGPFLTILDSKGALTTLVFCRSCQALFQGLSSSGSWKEDDCPLCGATE